MENNKETLNKLKDAPEKITVGDLAHTIKDLNMVAFGAVLITLGFIFGVGYKLAELKYEAKIERLDVSQHHLKETATQLEKAKENITSLEKVTIFSPSNTNPFTIAHPKVFISPITYSPGCNMSTTLWHLHTMLLSHL